jgi:hypothetical protein
MPVKGLYCLLFGIYLRIQFKTRPGRSSAKGVLFYALTAIFILCTAYFVVDVIGVQLYITVSHIHWQAVHYCSDVMTPNMSGGVQLIFEFPDVRAERRLIAVHLVLDIRRG